MKYITLLFLVLSISSCKTAGTSMLIGDSYDEKKDETTLMLLPYGNITLPKKWIKTDYLASSRQHFFINNDSTTISVAKNLREKYSFYNPNQSDKEFVTEFVKWDSDYWKEQGLNVMIIDDQANQDYILWQAKNKERNINTIFLFGVKNKFAYNFSATSRTWSETEIKDFFNPII